MTTRKTSGKCAYGHPMDGFTSGRRYCKTCNRKRVSDAAKRKKNYAARAK